MARIRSIKPEFWTSEQIVTCSPMARLLFIGMWNFCDCRGVHPASISRLKMEVFPGDSITLKQIEALIEELVSAKLLDSFDAEGEAFWYVTGWRHQKIKHPVFKYPPPPFTHNSPSATVVQGEHSRVKGIDEDEDEELDIEFDEEEKAASPLPRGRKRTVRLEEVTIPPELNTPEVRAALGDWLDYKRVSGSPYAKPSFIERKLGEFVRAGPQAFIDSVNNSIGNSWKGLFSSGDRTAKHNTGSKPGDPGRGRL